MGRFANFRFKWRTGRWGYILVGGYKELMESMCVLRKKGFMVETGQYMGKGACQIDKTNTWVFEFETFRIGYKKTIHKPDKHKPEQQIEVQELKRIEEAKIDTYA